MRAAVTSLRARRASPLLFIFVTVFVDMVGYGLVIPLLPFYAGEYARGAALIGALGALYAAMQFVGGPFLGGLSDRLGRRPVLLLCLLGASLAYLLLGPTREGSITSWTPHALPPTQHFGSASYCSPSARPSSTSS